MDGFSRVYYSSYKAGCSKGVAVLRLNKQTNCTGHRQEGRYLIVSGKIDHILETIRNIYVPTGSELTFYWRMFDLMIESKGVVVCGGDWNIHLNLKLDSVKTSTITSLDKKNVRLNDCTWCFRSLETHQVMLILFTCPLVIHIQE